MMKHWTSWRRARRRALWVGVIIAFYSAANVDAQSLYWLGSPNSRAYDVSDNAVVVGSAYDANNNLRAVRWINRQIEYLPTLGGLYATAFSLCPDGAYIVGWAYTSQGFQRPCLWFPSGFPIEVGLLQGNTLGSAYGVARNASVVVGNYFTLGTYGTAFMWSSGVRTDLGTLGGAGSAARSVSADGSVIVGVARRPDGNSRAFRWTQGTMQDLGTLGGNQSDAYDVSKVLGTEVIVGSSQNSSGQTRAFRWINGTMWDLGTLPGFSESVAYGVSRDGNVVVGSASRIGDSRAIRWSIQRGLEDLNQAYARLLSPNSRLIIARAVSPNGRYIVGEGFNSATGNTEAFLLDTWCISHNGDIDNNRCVDDADLLAVLFAFGQSGENLGRVDVNCDRVVDDADLLIVLFNFGSGC